jgi:ankyrin repeat protein
MKKNIYIPLLLIIFFGNISAIRAKGFPDLIVAVNKGDVKEVIRLLDSGADVNVKDSLGKTPLIHAVADFVSYDGYNESLCSHCTLIGFDRPEIVKALLDRGAKVVRKNNNTLTVLNYAAQLKAYESMKLLLKAVKKYDEQDQLTASALYSAALSGDAKMIDIVIQNGVKLNDLAAPGKMPENTHEESYVLNYNFGYLYLLDYDYNNIEGLIGWLNVGELALLYAARSGNVEAVKAILKAGVNLKSDEGGCSLAYINFNQEESVSVLKFLLKNGADAKGLGGERGLMNAAARGNGEAVELLLEAGAKVNKKGTWKGKSALIQAAEVGFQENVIQQDSLVCFGVLNALREGTAHGMWCEGDTAYIHVDDAYLKKLQKTLDNGHFKALKALIKYGADVNAIDNDGETALMKTAYEGDAETAKILIKSGANVNIKSKSGKTALSYALEENNKVTAEILKEAGATE